MGNEDVRVGSQIKVKKFIYHYHNVDYNMDENVHRFALSTIRRELLEREREREIDRQREIATNNK